MGAVSRAIGCALVLALAAPSGAVLAQEPGPAAAPADDLAGLWKAKLRLGPDARGTLIVRRSGDGWTADFMGRRIAVRRDGDVVSFALPNDEGAFRARLQRDGSLRNGQWIQPRSPANPWFATGVKFSPDGPGRWRGEVLPVEDSFTFYLMLQRRPDGTLGAYLRNPDRNMGVFYQADRLERDGDALKLIGKSPNGKADQVLMHGAFDRQGRRMVLQFANRGGTYDFRPEGDDSAFWPRGRNPGRYLYSPPLQRADGWPTASVEAVGIDRKGIESFIQRIVDTPIDSLDAPQVEGILIARHGKLVVEEYFHGEHRDRLHETRSAAKSLTATLVGAVLQDGLPVRLDDKVYAVMNGGRFPEGLDPQKQKMTLENLLTMSSGHYCDDGDPKAPGREDTMTDDSDDPDYYHFTMAVPMDRVPGERAVYCSADPNLAIGVVWRATGEHPMDLFDRLLGEPMQISRHAWFLSPAQQPYGGGSARMIPRDFMKLGQLMLNGGTWNGKRILGQDFVRRASSPLYDLNNIKYGYLWWVIDFPYKDRTVRAFFAGGNGGQGVIVIPELDMVVATFGGSYATRVGLEIQQGYTPRYILPAVREAGDPKDAPYVPREFTLVYGRRR